MCGHCEVTYTACDVSVKKVLYSIDRRYVSPIVRGF